MKRLTTAFALVVFGFNCWFAWTMLTLLLRVRESGRVLPAFTNLCINLRPLLLLLPIAAAAYALWLWFPKAEKLRASTTFVASTMLVLILFVFPALLTSYWLVSGPVKSLASQ